MIIKNKKLNILLINKNRISKINFINVLFS